MLSSKGYITEKEINGLKKKFSSIPEKDLINRIKTEIIKDSGDKSVKAQLEKTIANKIVESLGIIGKENLYEFLGVKPKTSLKTLQKRTEEKDTEVKKHALKDAINTASSELNW